MARRSYQGSGNPNWNGGAGSHHLYDLYNGIKNRCTRPSSINYKDYGGRGILMCDKWTNDFWAFVSDVGDRPDEYTRTGMSAYTLDRIDNDGNYEPGNVRWATRVEQSANRRPMKPRTHCKKGHLFTAETTCLRGDGSRFCRICERITRHARIARKKEAKND